MRFFAGLDEAEAAQKLLAKADKQYELLQQQLNEAQESIKLHRREVERGETLVQRAQEEAIELRKRLGHIDEEMVKQLQQDVTSLRYVNALLEQERDDLHRTLADTSTSLETLLQNKENSEDTRRVYVIGGNKNATPNEGEEALTQQEAQTKLGEMIAEFLPLATANDRDDLKEINGIGPFIEEKLNAAGIYTFEQISLLDEEFIEILTAAIGFFPDRIKRGRWIEQAKELWEEKEQVKLTLPHRDHDHDSDTAFG